MEHECNDIMTEDFILKHLFNNNDLIDKYKNSKREQK